MFCKNCGKEALPEQAKCDSCGFVFESEVTVPTEAAPVTNEKTQEKPYEKYQSSVKKMNILMLIMHTITLGLIICLIFLPFYKYKYEPSLEEIQNLEQLGEVLENGYLEKSFSLFDDLKIIFNCIFSENMSFASLFGAIDELIVSEFAIFVVLFGAFHLVMLIPSMLKIISSLQNCENATLLTYNEMLKTGNETKKENVLRRQTAFTLICYSVFDVFFSKIFGPFLYSGRKMTHLTGFSPAIAVIVVLFVAYVVVSILKKKETEKMLLDITKTQFGNNS